MKNIVIFSILVFSLFILGCASKSSSESASEPAAETGDSKSISTEKTAYDGKTGSGLLMERYQSGQIGGFRD